MPIKEKPVPASETVETFEKKYVLLDKKTQDDDRTPLSNEAFAICSLLTELINLMRAK